MDLTLAWECAGCRLAFSTAADGDMRDPSRQSAWLRGRHVVVPGQVHGIRIGDADAGSELAGCDGLVTRNPNCGVGVFGADCPGLVLIAPDALGAAHCGWRGTAGGIVGALAAVLAARSRHPPATWSAFIGPGISGPRYVVDGPVRSARAWPPQSLDQVDAEHAHLDLATAISADCRALGMHQITLSGLCTAGDPRLHSYRHQGRGLVQLLAVWRVIPNPA